jgi:hypothetical protein
MAHRTDGMFANRGRATRATPEACVKLSRTRLMRGQDSTPALCTLG